MAIPAASELLKSRVINPESSTSLSSNYTPLCTNGRECSQAKRALNFLAIADLNHDFRHLKRGFAENAAFRYHPARFCVESARVRSRDIGVVINDSERVLITLRCKSCFSRS